MRGEIARTQQAFLFTGQTQKAENVLFLPRFLEGRNHVSSTALPEALSWRRYRCGRR